MTDTFNILGAVASAFAIIGGMYYVYEFLYRKIRSRPYTKPLYLFAGTNDLRDRLVKLQGRVVNFDTILDFSISDQLSYRIFENTEYSELLSGEASTLNGKILPLYIVTKYQTIDSFTSLVLELREAHRLKFSYGGTGVVQVLLKGRFEVEVRSYSGPSIEITLREI